jgi:hypothetical protein
MLTRLKTYLQELVSDKKNWLILIPAMATLQPFITFFFYIKSKENFIFRYLYELTFKYRTPFEYSIFYYFFILLSCILCILYTKKLRLLSFLFTFLWLLLNIIHIWARLCPAED